MTYFASADPAMGCGSSSIKVHLLDEVFVEFHFFGVFNVGIKSNFMS